MKIDPRAIQIAVAFEIGEVVFLRCASERKPGIVTALSIRNGITYGVTWGDSRSETWHSAFELTDEYVPDFVSGNET